jgi:hypothetical protein
MGFVYMYVFIAPVHDRAMVSRLDVRGIQYPHVLQISVSPSVGFQKCNNYLKKIATGLDK